MRRALLLSLPFVLLTLTGCPSKPKNGECSSNKDCEAQEGYGKICIEGRCQECGQDTDCKAGFVCRDLKCVPRPECEKDADCPGGKSCQDGRCVAMAPKAECQADADCGAGRGCEDGKCVTKEAAAPGCPTDGNYEMVNFGFDQATLTPEARGILEKDAGCIKQQKPKRVTIAGHCDEQRPHSVQLNMSSTCFQVKWSMRDVP